MVLRYLKSVLDIDLKIILLNYQIKYVEWSSWLLEYQNFLYQFSLQLSSLHNKFDNARIIFFKFT